MMDDIREKIHNAQYNKSGEMHAFLNANSQETYTSDFKRVASPIHDDDDDLNVLHLINACFWLKI